MNNITQHRTTMPTRFTLKPLLLAIPLSVLAACANNQGPDLTDNIEASEEPIAQSSVTLSPVTLAPPANSLKSSDNLTENTSKGSDPMTVLVIENPDVLSKLASENLKPVVPMPAVTSMPVITSMPVLTTTPAATATPSSTPAESMHRPGKRVFHFGFNQTGLSEEDIDLIEQHAEYLKANPELKVTVHGHTDAQGNPDYNLALSQQRAAMMVSQLIKHGVNKDRIKSIGWGGGYPLVSSLNFAENRRIEMEYSEIHYAANQ